MSNELIIFINGVKTTCKDPDPEYTLAYYLRNILRMKGTKIGCNEGGCGACTVMVSSYNKKEGTYKHIAVNACLYPLAAAHGLAVTTVEGIGSVKMGVHPVQQRLALAHGTQCGFCSPGFVMSMYTLLRNSYGKDDTYLPPSEECIEEAIEANLCRCTGYRPILDGFKSFCHEKGKPAGGCCKNGAPENGQNGCCKNGATENGFYGCSSAENCKPGQGCCQNGSVENGVNGCPCSENGKSASGRRPQTSLIDWNTISPYDPTQDLIFPPELQVMHDTLHNEELLFTGPRVKWYRPTSIASLVKYLQANPDSKLIGGNTELALDAAFKNKRFASLVCFSGIPELKEISERPEGLRIGSAVSVEATKNLISHLAEKNPNKSLTRWHALEEVFKWFAGKQIRNVATLAGNLTNASPISDACPWLLVNEVILNVQNATGTRSVPVDDTFFVSYRQVNLCAEDLIVSIDFPHPQQNEYCGFYKVSRRKSDDIAIVNMCARVRFHPGTHQIAELKAAFGGVAAIPLLAKVVSSNHFHGRSWDTQLLQDVHETLMNQDIRLGDNAPGGFVSYRRCMILSLFYRFFESVKAKLEGLPESSVDPILLSAEGKEKYFASQLFDVPQANIGKTAVDNHLLGQPVAHQSALEHCSGEAQYVDDMPAQVGGTDELHMAFVLSERAHAILKDIDASEALQLPGVRACLTAKDVFSNSYGMKPQYNDERVFAEGKVTCVGQIVAGVVAISPHLAKQAALLVKVNYGEDLPAVLTVEDAIARGEECIPHPFFLKDGLPMDELLQKDTEKNLLVEEGEVRIAGQEHFYMEPNVALAVPQDGGKEVIIYASSQHPALIQKAAGKVLGIGAHRVAVRVKRLGGGFGGKELRNSLVALPCAVGALKLKEPIRCVLTRQDDMCLMGTRNPCMIRYKVAFTKEGKIVAVYANLYFNIGNTVDTSLAVALVGMLKMQNAYTIPNIELYAHGCLTNLPSNTAFRGFGMPQSVVGMETILCRIAERLNMSQHEVRELNFMKDGDYLPYGMTMKHCTIQRCWDECRELSGYDKLLTECQQFNSENRWRKRGVVMVPLVYGCSYESKENNQGFALVHVYMDGSVLVTHGGIEMGQGLHTKMLQVASHCLGLPMSHVHSMQVSTETVANTSATAASFSTDLNGHAIINACEQILERMKPYQLESEEDLKKNDGLRDFAKWCKAVNDAHVDGISLSASGHFLEPTVSVDPVTGLGHMCAYYSFGAACTKVEIDCLTGEHLVLSSDIVMDVGHSLNPAVDIGQIEGAFVQGMGMYTLEETRFTPQGKSLTQGPSTYKIPSVCDIPRHFKVHLLRECGNPFTPKAVHSSKAIGEPPLILGVSVFLAIREAVKAARQQNGLPIDASFKFDSPASVARIRLLCGDEFVSRLLPEKNKNDVDLMASTWEIRP